MRNRRRVWLTAAIAAAAVLSTAEIVGIVALNIVTSQSVATVGGCPSTAFPIRPGSELHQSSEITVGTATGCWATYDQSSSASEEEVFSYYLDPSNMPGWTLHEAYPNTRFAAFSNNKDPQIRADVGISTFRTLFVAGPSTVSLAISVCRCDPESMAQ